MAEILNLNKARKSKAKAGAKADAAENRVRFGRSKAIKASDTKTETLLQRHLDGHKRPDEHS
jgi:hypothetical protein